MKTQMMSNCQKPVVSIGTEFPAGKVVAINNDHVLIDTAKGVKQFSIQLYSVSGKLVHAQDQLQAGADIYIDQLPSGIYFAKIQGIQTLKSGMVNLYQNRMPVYEIMSGASIAIAALLLIIPGFFTDFLGFLLLVPFTRKLLFKLALKKNSQKEHEDQNKTLEGEIVDNKKDDT